MFSNERTFIHWIKFGMLLGALAMTLLNFSLPDSHHRIADQELARRVGQIGQAVGVSLMVICLLCLVYASLIYHWRHLGVARNKNDGRYFDRIGPTVLTFALIATYMVNVFLTVRVTSADEDFQPPTFYSNPHGPTAPSVFSPPILTPPAFDTPRLPPGSTIFVDNDDYDDEDNDDDDNDSDARIASKGSSKEISSESIEIDEKQPHATTGRGSSRPSKGTFGKDPSMKSSTDDDDNDEDDED
ncbi:hypothetical protein BGX28_003461 [Mortierella sp. GBA30]|nr:hypothetical protein BGX28_003461 [Mortierella sp. GBA30]